MAKLVPEESTPTGGITRTKQEIATRISTVCAVVSRVLRRLEQIGGVTSRHNGIVQVDPRALEALLGNPVVAVQVWEERLLFLAAS